MAASARERTSRHDHPAHTRQRPHHGGRAGGRRRASRRSPSTIRSCSPASRRRLSFLLGLRLEVARLRYELPFYFGGLVKRGTFLTALVGFVRGAVQGRAGRRRRAVHVRRHQHRPAVLGGGRVRRVRLRRREPAAAAVDPRRALPLRWGYFRLAPPLGLLFSAGLALLARRRLLPPSSVTDIGWKIIFEMPAQPSIEQVSELFFQLKQAFDDFIVERALSVRRRTEESARARRHRRQRQRAVGVRQRSLYRGARCRRAVRRRRATSASGFQARGSARDLGAWRCGLELTTRLDLRPSRSHNIYYGK